MALKGSNIRQNLTASKFLCNSDAPCSFAGYQCSLARPEGFEYCIRHILEDKTAPFRQCSYVYANSSKRCHKPSPVSERKEGYCADHARLVLRKRQICAMKPKPQDSAELCLSQLSHHQISPLSTLLNAIPDPANVPSIASAALQYVHPDKEDVNCFSEVDVRLLPRAEDDSELDSAESDANPLEHAVVFTTDEAARMYMEKLQKLKSLYSGELKRLHHLLKENRREYLHAVRVEKETLSSIYAQPKESVEEREAYQELKALARFHRPLGKEALLLRQSSEKRMQGSETSGPKPVGGVKCIYSEGSWRCGTKSVPLSKYCFKHIMQDERQVLFQSCGSVQGGGEECGVPVIPLPHTQMCIYHTSLPAPLPVTEPFASAEGVGSPASTNPKIIDLSDNGPFIITEIPPKDVMEGDCADSTPEKGPQPAKGKLQRGHTKDPNVT